MFTKLRNKFLILNITIISIMMLISFTTIYILTLNNVRNDIKKELYKISDINNRRIDEKNNMPPIRNDNIAVADRIAPPEPSPSFTLAVDELGNILSIFSVFDMDDEFYKEIYGLAINRNLEMDQIKLEGKYWTFLKRNHPNYAKIVFLDTTAQQTFLNGLIWTFITVATITLVIIFFISRFFANKSVSPIKDAFDRQKQFIADASHELKTPLAVIKTNVDVVLSSENSSIKDQSKWLEYIKREVDRMNNLVNDLLFLAKLDYSNSREKYFDFNLSDIIENVIISLEAVFYEKNIKLLYEIEENLLVNGNPQQLEQIFRILLDNAIKYIDDRREINVFLKQNNGKAVLVVENTSEGISDENISKVFDRFYRVENSRSKANEGYGLGLSIAKTMIEEHNGKLTAQSIPGGLTTFKMELTIVK